MRDYTQNSEAFTFLSADCIKIDASSPFLSVHMRQNDIVNVASINLQTNLSIEFVTPLPYPTRINTNSCVFSFTFDHLIKINQ